MDRVTVDLLPATDRQISRAYAASAAEVLEHIIDSGVAETSTNILDLDEVLHNVHRWKEAHPGLTPFYSPGVNDHPMVLTVLARLNIGFSCASKQEIDAVLQTGAVPSARVWLAHPCKTPDTIRYAQQTGIERVTCDSVQEMAKVQRLHPTASIVLRVRVTDEQKFGCCFTYDLPELCDFARLANLSIVGVHVMVPEAQQTAERSSWLRRSLSLAKDAIEYAHRMGLSAMRELVLSGTDSIEPQLLRRSLAALALPATVTFIIETGRQLVESAVSLVTNVQSKRVILHAYGQQSTTIREIMYFLNDGRYGSFEWWKAIDKCPTVRRRNEKARTPTDCSRPSSLWGPTCDSADVICERIELPELEVGDFLVFPDRGAYGVTIASRFNGFPVPKTVICSRLAATRALLHDCLQTIPLPGQPPTPTTE